MCIAAFVWQDHPLYPLILLFNRDEYHSRPSKPVSWWEGRDDILGGRDELGGGTWLACTRSGRLAFLTNVLEPSTLPDAKTRGDLTLRFLESKKSPMEFSDEVLMDADQYNGFNLILSDLCSKTMVYVSNRTKYDTSIRLISPGIHVLANANLDSSCYKVQRLSHNFKEQLDIYNKGEIPIKNLARELMTDTTKADESILPGILSVDWEYKSSSIYVDFQTPLGSCGTRSTTVLSLTKTGEMSFSEDFLTKEGWKEYVVDFQIDNNLNSKEVADSD